MPGEPLATRLRQPWYVNQCQYLPQPQGSKAATSLPRWWTPECHLGCLAGSILGTHALGKLQTQGPQEGQGACVQTSLLLTGLVPLPLLLQFFKAPKIKACRVLFLAAGHQGHKGHLSLSLPGTSNALLSVPSLGQLQKDHSMYHWKKPECLQPQGRKLPRKSHCTFPHLHNHSALGLRSIAGGMQA